MFLNKDLFIEQLFALIAEAKKELVLVVPYVKTSKEVFKALQEASKRGVEVLMVCREDCVKGKELDKLQRLEHLTILAHPNLHSKIYLNEQHIIVGSMNLYEYSELFNREAGIMIQRNGWASEEVEDCLEEVQQIISGASVVFHSPHVAEEGVDFTVLKSKKERLEDHAKILSKFFTTKKFQVLQTEEGLCPTCLHFYDQIDVVVSNRLVLQLQYPKPIAKKVIEHFKQLPEDYLANFRTYVDAYKPQITIYAEEGSYIGGHIYTDRSYAKTLETAALSLCKEIDHIYKQVRVL